MTTLGNVCPFVDSLTIDEGRDSEVKVPGVSSNAVYYWMKRVGNSGEYVITYIPESGDSLCFTPDAGYNAPLSTYYYLQVQDGYCVTRSNDMKVDLSFTPDEHPDIAVNNLSVDLSTNSIVANVQNYGPETIEKAKYTLKYTILNISDETSKTITAASADKQDMQPNGSVGDNWTWTATGKFNFQADKAYRVTATIAFTTASKLVDQVPQNNERTIDVCTFVPGDTVCIIGTTSTRIPLENCHKVTVTPDEVTLLVTEGAKLSPALSETRILRAFAGVRPLVSDDSDPTGRNISRGIVCLDHETRDGLKGLVTITGGKLTTYRQMAEQATDVVCRKLGVTKACETAIKPLIGSEGRSYEEVAREIWETPSTAQKAATSRLGSVVSEMPKHSRQDEALVCECEEVPVWEVNNAFERMGVSSLTDLRRRTRVGMGTCQGEFCACRAAGLLAKAQDCAERERADLLKFMGERWKGNYPIGWGESLREAEYTQWVYKHVLGL